jgi:hypothetical protein
MKVHDNCPKPGRVWSIEVSSFIGRRKLARILAAVPGVRIIKMPGYLSRLSDKPFCRFELDGHLFVVEATWPSGNRFVISPEPQGCVDQLLVVRQVLAQHRSFWGRLLAPSRLRVGK